MRTLVNIFRKRIGAPLAALVALVAMLSFGPAPQAQADMNDEPVTMTAPGGYSGRAVVGHGALKSSATPIGQSAADPIGGSLPGRVTLYTSGTGSWQGLVRIRTTRKDRPTVINNFAVTVEGSDPLSFELKWWDAAYSVVLFEDTNGNGVIDAGDRRVRGLRVRTSRGWAWRRGWLTRQWDVVVAANTDGGSNPPPATTYPNGAIVSINGRAGNVGITRIDYTVGTSWFGFTYANVPKDRWAFEQLRQFDGQTVTVKVTWSDGKTQTKIVGAPANASAAASVSTFDTPDN